MKILVVALLLGVATVAWSQETWVHVNGHSWHDHSGYNNHNLGAGMEVSVAKDWNLAAGGYRNSVYKDSLYALAKYRWYQFDTVSVNVNLGGVTGYRGYTIVPVILPEVCWSWICGFYIPKFGDVGAGAAAFYLRIPIK